VSALARVQASTQTGIDLFYGLSSVLVAVAQQFERARTPPSPETVTSPTIDQVSEGLARSRINGRGLYPEISGR
jgi:hypothetical protein